MKHLKLAVIAIFALATISQANAQDENNPWVVGLGGNIVDYYTGTGLGKHLKDLLGNEDWNISPISRISLDKYIKKGFSVQVSGSLNSIKSLERADDVDFSYLALDAIVKYDLNTLVGETAWFDPYIYLGGGYASANSVGEGMINTGVGFNTWVNEKLGLNFQTGTKLGFLDNVGTHYQTTFGVVYRFGGKDTDGDGVYDKNDACPEVAGLKELNGCPDSDGDGIKDSDDACPFVSGLPALNGCPDADADGIADKDDMCPNEKGTKANKGCPDTDGDGVINKNDKCPDVAGPVENLGCPWPDTDSDGVLDKDDKCITVAGPASNKGCPIPVITKAVEDAINIAAKTILFNSGKTTFKRGVTAKLNDIVALMKKYPKATFIIEGHTDSVGRASSNENISNRRAIAVRDYLVENGIETTRLVAKGFGEGFPIATNKTREGQAKNRRVMIKTTNKK